MFVKEEFYYLNVSRVGTFTVYDIFDCTFECLSNPSCLSVNMATSKGANGELWCELLSSDKYRNSTEYEGNKSSHHFSRKVWNILNKKCTILTNQWRSFAVFAVDGCFVLCLILFCLRSSNIAWDKEKNWQTNCTSFYSHPVLRRPVKTKVPAWRTTNMTHLSAFVWSLPAEKIVKQVNKFYSTISSQHTHYLIA